MKNKDLWTWAAIAAGAAALIYFVQSQGGTTSTTATPLSVYPSLAWTAQPTSMAATPAQHASTAVVQAPQYTSVQQSEQSAIYAQCVGANVCSPITGDTQLGL